MNSPAGRTRLRVLVCPVAHDVPHLLTYGYAFRIVPFLPARSEFDMQRNQARQKLATMPASKFEGRCIDIYFELAWRYPRVLREVRPPSLV